jgi:hypothetical protein
MSQPRPGKDIQTYHIGGIPAAYIIDGKETIVDSGFANEMSIANTINHNLKTGENGPKRE